MLSRTRLLPIVVFFSLAALTPRAHATLAQVMPFDDKVEHASSIIVGKCMATRSEWDTDHRWILTYSTFKVEQSMKGSAPPDVTIVTPGGQAGGISQDTIGVPSFHKDDENVIFTKNTAHGPTVLYFDQGAYDVSGSDRRGQPGRCSSTRSDRRTSRSV